jgi:DnaJ-class molecular chaperone
MSTLYTILGVSNIATPKELKLAYRTLASKYHPDRYKGDPKIMTDINAAYSILSNVEQRQHYDQTGETSASPTVDQQALSIVTTRLGALMSQHDYEPKNYFKLLRSELQTNLNSMAKHRLTATEEMVKLTYLIENSNFNNEDILSSMNHKLQEMRQGIAHIETQEPIFERVRELLAECEYTGKIPEVKEWGTTGMSFNQFGGMNTRCP